MAAGIPVISEVQWARIIAKAYLDGTTGDLEKDPKKFVDGVRSADDPPGMKSLPDPVRLLTIDYSHYGGGPDSEAMDVLAIFRGSNSQQLQDLFNTGKFLGQPVEMPPGEWIDPFPSALRRLFQHSGPPSIQLQDWMRIYAYVWHQFRFALPQPPPPTDNIRLRFETDPAQTLAKEIAGPLGISYVLGNPLFTLGTPDPPGDLPVIRGDGNAKGFRHRIRLTC